MHMQTKTRSKCCCGDEHVRTHVGHIVVRLGKDHASAGLLGDELLLLSEALRFLHGLTLELQKQQPQIQTQQECSCTRKPKTRK